VERFIARVEDEEIAGAEKRRRRSIGSERFLHGFANRLVWLTFQRSKEDVFRRRRWQEERRKEEELKVPGRRYICTKTSRSLASSWILIDLKIQLGMQVEIHRYS
jgi:hypothetical protein